MAREIELTCPSGLQVRLRSVKGRDLDGLKDKRRVQTGEAISQLLDDCTLEVLERSIYTKAPAFKWADALVGDRMKAIVGLRGATTGDEFEFRIRCQDKECRQMIDWSLDLNTLDVKPLSEESKATFLEQGNSFMTAVAGPIVHFRLSTGRDQIKLAKFAQAIKQPRASNDESRLLLGVASRIVQVDGVDDVMKWLGDLDLGEISALIKAMDAVDCGVETGIEITCSGDNGCGLIQQVELPLDSTFFARAS
jgi:hypothetical protein